MGGRPRPVHRSGHLYMSLVDPEDNGPRRDRGRGGVPTLNVKCWRTSWAPLRHGLAKQGIQLAERMVVVLRGALEAEGLLRRNATPPVPEVPLHVGLVARPGTEGCHDFLGQLTRSGSDSASASRTCAAQSGRGLGDGPKPV